MFFIYDTQLIFLLKIYQGTVNFSISSIFGIYFEVNPLKVDLSEIFTNVAIFWKKNPVTKNTHKYPCIRKNR